MQAYDVIILGGGISGLTFGRLLQMHTDKKFLILEKESEPGGLCRTKHLGGNHFDIGGGHFLYSKHQPVYDFIFSHVAKDQFNEFDRVTNIHIHGMYVDYPLEQNLWQLPEDTQVSYADSIIDAIKSTHHGVGFNQWLYRNLGSQITNNYLVPYNKKLWGIDPKHLSTEWLYKIPPVDVKDILRSLILRRANSKAIPSHPYFYYPKQGGFQTITDAIYAPIKEHVVCSEPVSGIVNMFDKWFINGKYSAPIVINTIPWSSVTDPASGFSHPLIATLKHSSLVVSFEKEEAGEAVKSKWMWTYEPDENVSYHRKFYLQNYCPGNADSCVALETNLNRWVRTGTELYSHLNEFAYPIPTLNLEKDIRQILRHYEARKLYGLGRWGQWAYHNSDVCILEAMKLFNRLFATPDTMLTVQ
ncbi:MAG TPA: NAD(P)-binding protein [Anaerovoracaceae bacterium]|nr:NAD(P)-binding protein [Anaerovoracaceae bacterium]